MNTIAKRHNQLWSDSIAPQIRSLWIARRRALLLTAISAMCIMAAGRLGYALPYLVEDVAPWAAIDFENRYVEVNRWFSGLPLYGAVANGDYPPASYTMLWVLLGWLALTPARWLWAASIIAATAAISYLTLKVVDPATRTQRILAAGLIFSIYPTQMTMFVGQTGLHVLALLIAGFLVLSKANGRVRGDLAASLLLVLALVKPTLSVPFFWIVLFSPGRIRPMVLVATAYLALTIVASLFQSEGLFSLLQGWLDQADAQVATLDGTVNIHKWLTLAGLDQWLLPASALILAFLAIWTYRHRRADVWLLAGVAALAARFWVHHRLYDDMLILMPMIALFRMTTSGPTRSGSDIAAGLLLAATWATLHIPTWAFYDLARPIVLSIEVLQTVVWLSVLLFLVRQAQRAEE